MRTTWKRQKNIAKSFSHRLRKWPYCPNTPALLPQFTCRLKCIKNRTGARILGKTSFHLLAATRSFSLSIIYHCLQYEDAIRVADGCFVNIYRENHLLSEALGTKNQVRKQGYQLQGHCSENSLLLSTYNANEIRFIQIKQASNRKFGSRIVILKDCLRIASPGAFPQP